MAVKALEERMTVDAFIEWATAQPRSKARVWREPDRAIGAQRLPCEALPDGPTVPIDATTSYEPDVLVHCGDSLDPDAVKVTDPVSVVEVGSHSTRGLDVGLKLPDYFQLDSAHTTSWSTPTAV